MGVTKLWSYMKSKRNDCIEYVDLVKIAAEKPEGGILLIDFYCWELYMRDRCDACLFRRTKNPYLCLYGGEYKVISDYITSFVEAFRSINIELTFYLDGSKGTSQQATEQKWKTWIQRQNEDVMRVRTIISFFNGEIPLENLDVRNLTRPCLQEVQNIITLQKLGCKIHPVVSGEADTYIAQRMKDDERVIAVFSNDSDFSIFPGSVLMSDGLFDLENDLELVDSSMKVKKPLKLMCGFIRSESLLNHFKFPGIESLCELAIIAGNDFTLPIMNELKNSTKNLVGNIKNCARIIRQCGVVENCPQFAALMVTMPDLAKAVTFSRQFYSLNLVEKGNGSKDGVHAILREGIKEARYPSSLFAMSKRFYWHRMVVEDVRESCNTAERSMVYLRSFVYTMLLPQQVNSVMEYGRSPDQTFQQMTALKYFDHPIPSLTVINKNSFVKNKQIFHNIMTHQEDYIEDYYSNNYFRQYGNKLGFSCYLLRYFLLLNWQQNLYIKPGEFLLLCAWVLGCHDSTNYETLKVIPSSRCISIENWLLCLFRTSHAFIGNLLKLSPTFPTPSDLFSGTVWVSFYSGSSYGPEYQFQTRANMCLSPEDIKMINSNIKEILTDQKHIIRNIVKELFPVNL